MRTSQQVQVEAGGSFLAFNFYHHHASLTEHYQAYCVVITQSNQKDATNYYEVACFMCWSSMLHFGLLADPAEMGAGRQSSEQEFPATIEWFKCGVSYFSYLCAVLSYRVLPTNRFFIIERGRFRCQTGRSLIEIIRA